MRQLLYAYYDTTPPPPPPPPSNIPSVTVTAVLSDPLTSYKCTAELCVLRKEGSIYIFSRIMEKKCPALIV